MARVLNNGLLSGAVGDLVYYVVNGKQYVRKKGKPNDPNTELQQHQRAKMRACSKFLCLFREVIKLGYQGSRIDYVDYNEAMKYHLANALEDITAEDSTQIVYRINYDKVKLSRGNIDKPEIYTCERTGQTIELTWNEYLGDYPNRFSDAMAVVAYQPGEKPFVDFHKAVRFESQATINLPPKLTEPLHVWVFYYNAERTGPKGKERSSDSVYLGII